MMIGEFSAKIMQSPGKTTVAIYIESVGENAGATGLTFWTGPKSDLNS